MAQTRIFRDRLVSMEQTLEGGEKNLDLLKELCREAMPEFEYREHVLDHERDLFVMSLEAADGRRKRVAWTRMTLFDAERIPSLAAQPDSDLRERVVGFLRDRALRPEIVVTFRHLEDGWTDTPEARPSKRRRRRGGRGSGRPGEARRPVPAGGPRPAPSPKPSSPGPAAPPAAAGGGTDAASRRPAGPGRRRFRRRRRGRGPGTAPTGAPRTP